jgi:hypothetical protein
MKRSLLPIFSLFLGVSILYGCCNCSKSVSEGNTIKGILTALGNEPFVEIGIKTEDNTNYQLICSKELKTELMKQQGTWYAIQYREQITENGVHKLVVEKAIQIIQK